MSSGLCPEPARGASLRRKAVTGLAAASIAIVTLAGTAGAQEADPVTALGQQVNLLWIVIGAVLVIFMQAGFALVETGFCRAKHAAHVVSTNFAIFGLGFVGYFLVGYAFMFGGASFGAYIPGYDAPLGGELLGIGNWTFLWQGGFALSGEAPSPRASSACSSTWSPSWTPSPRSRRGRWPSVGSGTASSAGACSAAPSTTRSSGRGPGAAAGWPRPGTRWASAPATSTSPAPASSTPSAVRPPSPVRIVLGPRLGKFNKDGSPNTLPGHHIPMAHAGDVHPPVRLVRLQRGVDVRRDRHPVRHGRGQHRHRRRLRCRRARCS